MTKKFDAKRFAKAGPMPTPKSNRPPRHKQGEWFLRGPVPMNWLASAAQLPGRALMVGLVLWHLAGLQNRCTVKWQPKRAGQLGLRRHAIYRGLQALESAGLIDVERKPGQAPTVTIQNAQNAS